MVSRESELDIERGTIFRNMHHPELEIYLIYLYSRFNDAFCIKITMNKHGESDIIFNCPMWKASIVKDRDHFPIVGFIDID